MPILQLTSDEYTADHSKLFITMTTNPVLEKYFHLFANPSVKTTSMAMRPKYKYFASAQ